MSSLGRDSGDRASLLVHAPSGNGSSRTSAELHLVGPQEAAETPVVRGLAAIDDGFEVTSLEDNLTTDGQLTLREAIRNANANPDANTITFADSIAGGTIALTNGQLEITSSVTIEGGDQTINQTTDELSNNLDHRALLIDGSAASNEINVDLSLVTVSGGRNTSGGGGIRNTGAHTTLDSVVVERNDADVGGGIWNDGHLRLQDVNFVSNSTVIDRDGAPPAGVGLGGGAYNIGTMEIRQGEFYGNYAYDAGGAIRNNGEIKIYGTDFVKNASGSFEYYTGDGGAIWNGGRLHISEASISDGEVFNQGGGIFNSGELFLENSSVTNNTMGNKFVQNGGGGLTNFGHATIIDTKISGNYAYLAGGGIFSNSILVIKDSRIENNSTSGGYPGRAGGGGGLFNSGEADIVATTFSGNSTIYNGGGILNNGYVSLDFVDIHNNGSGYKGGGIHTASEMRIQNSIIEQNQAYVAAGIFNSSNLNITHTTINNNLSVYSGGGLTNLAMLTISNVTISNNEAGYEGGGIRNEGDLLVNQSTLSANSAYRGGGISDEGQATISNSIVAGSRGGLDVVGDLIVQGTNIVEDGSLTGAAVINGDPFLGPLQDNGGATLTLALLAGSPAIGAADPAITLTTDQRGFARDTNPDIGAFELQMASPADDLSYVPVTAIPGAAILGTPDDNRLDGTNGAEYFNARAGSDDELGDGGNDVFLMGPGRDFIGGGGGNDTALFDGLIDDFDGLNFDGDLTYIVTDTNPSDGDSGRDRLGGVETFEFKDALFDATNGDITPKANGALSYVPVTAIPSREGFGTEHDNRLVGSKAAEYFDAGGGSDDELGNGGDDVFLMGPGRDFIGGGGGNDTALFDGLIDDFDGLNFDGDLTYFVTDTNPSDGDSGRDRLGGVETFEFRDALFDATTGEITVRLEPLIVDSTIVS